MKVLWLKFLNIIYKILEILLWIISYSIIGFLYLAMFLFIIGILLLPVVGLIALIKLIL
jgi:hypothetical protein